MPHAAPRPCPVCQRVGCTDHTGRRATPQQDKDRGTRHERGYDNRWVRARAGYLAHHPLCAECGRHGRVTAATVVDHIVPHRRDMSLFWDTTNWQPLCKRCHDRKTGLGK